jgi:flagellar basal-body rod protein FlgF
MPDIISKAPAISKTPNMVMLAMQRSLEKSLEVSSNNLTNAFTSGFKRVIFSPEHTIVKTKDREKTSTVKSGVNVYDLSDGSLNMTKNPLDVAISGKGFFTIQTPRGLRYTRCGQFTTDLNGRLVNASGYAVLNQSGGEILIPRSVKDFKISSNGTISIDGQNAGRIGVVRFENEQNFFPEGQGLLNTTESPIQSEFKDFKITQGAFEESNTSPMAESIKLVEIMRRFDEAQNLIKQFEELQKKTMNASAKNI